MSQLMNRLFPMEQLKAKEITLWRVSLNPDGEVLYLHDLVKWERATGRKPDPIVEGEPEDYGHGPMLLLMTIQKNVIPLRDIGFIAEIDERDDGSYKVTIVRPDPPREDSDA